MLNPKLILQKYIDPDSDCFRILWEHSNSVMKKACLIVEKHPELKANLQFVKEAALLHDLGIYQTNAPMIGCNGELPYLCHGYIGHDLLLQEGLPKHALVCERHTGVGLTIEEIKKQKLPLPHREMLPVSIEEKIICYADSFFSKTHLDTEFEVYEIVVKLNKFGKDKSDQFLEWHKIFSV